MNTFLLMVHESQKYSPRHKRGHALLVGVLVLGLIGFTLAAVQSITITADQLRTSQFAATAASGQQDVTVVRDCTDGGCQSLILTAEEAVLCEAGKRYVIKNPQNTSSGLTVEVEITWQPGEPQDVANNRGVAQPLVYFLDTTGSPLVLACTAGSSVSDVAEGVQTDAGVDAMLESNVLGPHYTGNVPTDIQNALAGQVNEDVSSGISGAFDPMSPSTDGSGSTGSWSSTDALDDIAGSTGGQDTQSTDTERGDGSDGGVGSYTGVYDPNNVGYDYSPLTPPEDIVNPDVGYDYSPRTPSSETFNPNVGYEYPARSAGNDDGFFTDIRRFFGNLQQQTSGILGGILQGVVGALGGGQQGPGGGSGGGERCTPERFCSNNTLHERSSSCQERAVQTCPFGCSNRACNTSPQDDDSGMTAELTCAPPVAERGTPISLSWACRNAETSSGEGFDTEGKRSGSLTIATDDVPQDLTKLAYALTCTSGNVTRSKVCEVQLSEPKVVVVANPNPAPSNTEVRVGWVSVGMQTCAVTSEDISELNESGTSGAFTLQSISATSTIAVDCETVAGEEKGITVEIVPAS